MMIKIRKYAWIGAHSSAKTTTVNRIAAMLEAEGKPYKKVTEVIRQFRGSINEDGGFGTQIFCVDRQGLAEWNAALKLLTLSDDGEVYILCDRSIWDSLPYALHLKDIGRMTVEEVLMIEDSIMKWIEILTPYDAIFFCEPKPLYEDGVRSTKQEFQDAIYEKFKYVIKHYDLNVTVIQ
jgi:hypothetical protein